MSVSRLLDYLFVKNLDFICGVSTSLAMIDGSVAWGFSAADGLNSFEFLSMKAIEGIG